MGLLIFLDSVFCSIDFLCLLTPILHCLAYCNFVLQTVYCVAYGNLYLRNRLVLSHWDAQPILHLLICVDLWLLWLICDRRVSMCLLETAFRSLTVPCLVFLNAHSGTNQAIYKHFGSSLMSPRYEEVQASHTKRLHIARDAWQATPAPAVPNPDPTQEIEIIFMQL